MSLNRVTSNYASNRRANKGRRLNLHPERCHAGAESVSVIRSGLGSVHATLRGKPRRPVHHSKRQRLAVDHIVFRTTRVMAPRKGKKIEVGNSSNESDTRAPDPEPPVYVSYADFQTLTRNMEAFKAGYGHKRFGSDGDSFRDSSEDNSGTDDVEVPAYKVHCCRQHFSSTQALFAHLRLSHKIGIQPNMTRRCKLCRSWMTMNMIRKLGSLSWFRVVISVLIQFS
ncbi:unnamed protein product [Allacma fusca]|uniref:Uncharacterized protein n=1 Tax=Allacma fusca TaxID=39272 RepID=A0A8J2PRV3_9HEXA|nr:unnamed protein product [Allacma fusca]